VSDLRIYDKALSAEDVNKIYTFEVNNNYDGS